MWGAAAAFVAVVVIVAALPLIASTQIVRYRIAQEMSAWSGYRVILGSSPEIRVWPTFRAVLNNVTLSEWGTDGRSPVIQADRVEIDLSAFDALLGEVRFSKVRLIRPVLHVVPSEHGIYWPPPADGGRLAGAIDTARAAIKANAGRPDTSKFPTYAFGSIEFSDGRIVTRQAGKTIELVSGLAGNIKWPELDSSASLSATGIWRGESVTLDATSQDPLILFAGGNAKVTLNLQSAPLKASFDGIASLSGPPFFDGALKFASPSVRRMLEWSHADIASGTPIGSISITGRISGDVDRLKLDKAEISIDGNPGIGGLDVSFKGPIPSISGTLAFDALDMQSFLAAFTPLAVPDNQDPGVHRAPLANQVNLDLRLSAVKATMGTVAMSDVAATAQVKDGLAVFDISDASAFGGSLQAGFHITHHREGNSVELRFLASGIDGAAFAKTAGIKMFPKAKTNISVSIKGPGGDWSSILANGAGKVSASFANGSIDGIDLPGFLKRAAAGGFFPLSDVSRGRLAIDSAEIKGTIENGVLKIDKAVAKTAAHRIEIGGIIIYSGRGLALSGSVAQNAAKGQKNAPDPVAFFVGGSWSAPFISAVLPAPTP